MPRGGQSGCVRGAAASRRATRATGAAHPRRGDLPTVALAVALAFGYAPTLVPLPRAGLDLGTALGLALAADPASIAVMEVVDNAVMLAVPGAMDTGPRAACPLRAADRHPRESRFGAISRRDQANADA
jgi:Domain of unknown function (DUF4396)